MVTRYSAALLCCTTILLRYNTILHSYTTLLYYTTILHYYATLLCYTHILHYYTTLLYYTTMLHYYTTLLYYYTTQLCYTYMYTTILLRLTAGHMCRPASRRLRVASSPSTKIPVSSQQPSSVHLNDFTISSHLSLYPPPLPIPSSPYPPPHHIPLLSLSRSSPYLPPPATQDPCAFSALSQSPRDIRTPSLSPLASVRASRSSPTLRRAHSSS